MATVTLEYISSLTDNATLSYLASGFSLPTDPAPSSSGWVPPENDSVSSQTNTSTTIHYHDLVYTWDFGGTGPSGQHTFTGLAPGEANTITAIVTVTCTKTVTVSTRFRSRDWIEDKEDPTKSHWGAWHSDGTNSGSDDSTVSAEPGSASGSKVVYTKPSDFEWSGKIVFDATIEENLFAADWNKLVETAEKRANWKNQTPGANFSSDEVTKGDTITATKYNSLSGHCDCGNQVEKDVTVISANLFIDLATSVNGGL